MESEDKKVAAGLAFIAVVVGLALAVGVLYTCSKVGYASGYLDGSRVGIPTKCFNHKMFYRLNYIDLDKNWTPLLGDNGQQVDCNDNS